MCVSPSGRAWPPLSQLTVDFSANGPQSIESDFKTIHAIDDMNLMNEVSQVHWRILSLRGLSFQLFAFLCATSHPCCCGFLSSEQTNFSVSVTVPPGTKCVNNMCVLRLRYVSNNPGENDRGEV